MNPRFEEHEGQLFRMLEEPEPLTPDAEMPCLVRLIQDDSPMGMYNRDMNCFGVTGKILFVAQKIKENSFYRNTLHAYEKNSLNQDYCIASIHTLEIIGYPVDEGSHWWALYQMMQGEKVRHNSYVLPNTHCAMNEKCQIAIFTTQSSMIYGGDVVCHANDWLTSRQVDTMVDERTGWQLYKEPKPEPKPLLADAKVGDLCKHRNGDWSQIIDTNGTYIQGQPIRTTLKDTKGINRNFCLSGSHFTMQFGGEYDIIHTEPLVPEGSAEWAWQMAKLGIETKCIYGKIRIPDSGMTEVCYNGMAYAMPLTQSAENRKYIINKIRECSPDGWQLYEPEQPKYKVGDWVEVNDNGVKKQGKIMRFCEAGFLQDNTSALVLHDVFDRWYGYHRVADITRKLSPSDVIHIGCLSGTVRPVSTNGIHIWFHLVDVDDKTIATIRISCLDAQTRELVESLLEAMRGEEK